MTDSLDNRSSFSDLEFSNVASLIGVLLEAELTTQDHLRRRFQERAIHYEATLEFLINIEAVRNEDDRLTFSPSMKEALSEADRESMRSEIIALLAQRTSTYQSEAFEYLRRFALIDGFATYKPADSERSAESSVRNFLMEVGVVSCLTAEDRYVITSENNFLFTLAKARASKPLSPLVFESARKRREDIGYNAELCVLDYERERLGEKYISMIEHVAAKNVAAGYDIKSVTIGPSGKELPRYVEVKAVPISNLRFYWSSNERDVAKMFGPYYFLYLLPVGRDGEMDSTELMIIEDPIASVLESPEYWLIESDVIKCTQKTSFSD